MRPPLFAQPSEVQTAEAHFPLPIPIGGRLKYFQRTSQAMGPLEASFISNVWVGFFKPQARDRMPAESCPNGREGKETDDSSQQAEKSPLPTKMRETRPPNLARFEMSARIIRKMSESVEVAVENGGPVLCVASIAAAAMVDLLN